MDHCLKDLPKRLMVGTNCGNGFLEPGEECDCGPETYCDSKCCNATTCKLMPGAQCAVGQCCDKSTCTIVPRTVDKVCRPALSECDLPETCDGSTEFCPKDGYVHDGRECRHGEAFCYAGRCSSYDSQCRLLWGPSGRV